MRVGVPQEIKVHEYRVGLTPASVREYVAHGHEVLVQSGAGAAIGMDDAPYRAAGARVVPDAAAVFVTPTSAPNEQKPCSSGGLT